MASENSWYVIINPASGNGAGKRKWPRIKALLEKHKFTFKFVLTKHKGHSREIVQDSVNQGFKQIICVGGDGTIHNTVNGIMQQKIYDTSEIHLGVIPVGTGNDWIKTHKISKNLEKAIITIKNQNVKQQDIGRINFTTEDKPSVYFNNLAGVGFDGYVVSRVEKIKYLGSLAYIFGALIGIFSAKRFKTEVSYNSKKSDSNALMVLIGLCQFSGGGMQLTKEASPNDGFFDISIANNFSGLDIVKNIVKLFNGKVTESKKIITLKSNVVSIEIIDGSSPFIQADGELIGTGNFKATLLPNALSFYA